MLKFGFDIHGVLDTKPRFYSLLTKRLVSLGHEVHIITGAHRTDSLIGELDSYGIEWTHFFSIADYHVSIGTSIEYSDTNNPWMSSDKWDRTKADYCKLNKIDLHIDDSEVYGKYFTSTVYVQIKNN